MRRRADLLALFGYLLASLAFTFPLVLQFTRAIPGDGFDGWQNYWNLWWLKISLVERHASPYFTDLLYYPTGVSLLFHTLNPFNGLFSLPVQLAWGLLPAYNFAVLFSLAAGGFGSYLLARLALGRRSAWPAAFLAGLIFTFAPYHIAHLLGHLQLIALEWIPFYALYVLRLARHVPNKFGPPLRASHRQRPELVRGLPLKDILLAGVFLVLVALCDWYYVLYCLIFSAIVLLWLLARSVVVAYRGTELAGSALGTSAAPMAEAGMVPYTMAGSSEPSQVPGDSPSAAGHGRPSMSARLDFLRLARFTLSLALAGLLFLLVVSPILLPMLHEASQSGYMVPDASQSRTFSADLLAFVTPQEFHPLWGHAAQALASVFTATVAEHQVFAGYTVLILAGLGAWAGLRSRGTRRRGGDVEVSSHNPGARLATLPETQTADVAGIPANPWFWLAVLLAFFLLALGPVLHIAGQTALLPGGGEIRLPYAWLRQTIPFLNVSRSVSRFDVMVMLALGVLSAFGLQWLWEHGRASKIAGTAAIALVLFEFWPAPYPLSSPDTPAWYASLAADEQTGAVLNLPANWDRPGYLLYQTVHGKPLTAAYVSRDDPRTLIERAPVLQHFRHLGPDIIDLDLATQGQHVLASLGVRWVVLDRYKMPGSRERSYNEDAAALIFGLQQPAYADQRLTAYEVKPLPAGGQPFAILGSGWDAFDPTTRSRRFTDHAELIIQADGAGPAILHLTLVPSSAPLDAGPGPNYTFPLSLSPGSNQFTLHANLHDSPVIVKSIAVVPGQ